MAEALWRMRGGRTRLLTALGDDADGKFLTNIAPGLILDGCVVQNAKTSMYAAVFDAKGECLLGLGDMNIHEHLTINLINEHKERLKKAPLVVLDGNVPQRTLDHVLKLCQQFKKPVFFEPTDRRKASKALHGAHQLAYASPNISELRVMAEFIKPNNVVDNSSQLNEIIGLSKIVSQYISLLIVTFGSRGVITARRQDDNGRKSLLVRFYAVDALKNVENVSGAGDCFSSGFIHGSLLNFEESCCVAMGFEAAKHALLCKQTVPREFSFTPSIKQAKFEMWKYDIK